MPWLYDDPEKLDYSAVDEPIREIVNTINLSSWLRTEESCSGHPAGSVPGAWGGTTLYLRLVVLNVAHIPYLLRLSDYVQEGIGIGSGWCVRLAYDRTDRLGTHWFFELTYGDDIHLRSTAVDLVARMFERVSVELQKRSSLASH